MSEKKQIKNVQKKPLKKEPIVRKNMIAKETTMISKQDEQKKNKKLLILLLLLFIVFCPLIGLGANFERIRGTVEFIFKGTPTAPIITGGSNDWAKSRIISVLKDSKGKNAIAYYEYCITSEKTSRNCTWSKTETKNVQITKTGIYSVYFRAVDSKDKRGFVSSPELIKLDNANPIIEELNIVELTSTTLKIKVNATDKHSGIKKYYYMLSSVDIIESDLNTYQTDKLIPGTKYTLKVKVVDHLGNNIDLEQEFTTPTSAPEEEKDVVVDAELEMPTYESNPDNYTWAPSKNVIINFMQGNYKKEYSLDFGKTWNIYTEAISFTKAGYIIARISNEGKTLTAEPYRVMFIDNQIPKLSLENLPLEFEYQEKYKLPSWVEYGQSGGTVQCLVDGIKQVDTYLLKIGKHHVICTATSNAGLKATIEKDFEVKYIKGSDEIWDGWIKLNLDYPPESYDRQWRLGTPGEIRDPLEENANWQDYVGPIVVKTTDVENIYIRYKLDDKQITVPPAGQILVDIEAETNPVLEGSKTKVTINYDSKSTAKQYRLNKGPWEMYDGPLEISGNTVVEAKAIYEEKVNDSNGDYLLTRKTTGEDSLYIRQRGLNLPEDPSYSEDDYLEILISASNTLLKPGEEATVVISASSSAEIVRYRINGGEWVNYTESFVIKENAYIEAEAHKVIVTGLVSTKTTQMIKVVDPKDELKVQIKAKENILEKDKTTTVTIEYSNNTEIKMYRVNAGNWQEYQGSFEAGANTYIEAYGTSLDRKTETSLYINEIKAPVDPSILGARIKPTNLFVKIDDKTSVTIDYYGDPEIKEYRINGGVWTTYINTFEISPFTLIEARAKKGNDTSYDTVFINILVDETSGNEPTPPKDDQGNVIPSYGSIKISSSKSSVKAGETTKITIHYTNNMSDHLYSINGGEWIIYTEPFEVGPNTQISAKAVVKKGTPYSGQLLLPYDITVNGYYYVVLSENTSDEELKGPNIIIENTTDKKKATLKLTTELPSREIYYRLKDGSWQMYQHEIVINRNQLVEAYYITEEEGERSGISSMVVPPIFQPTEGERPVLQIKADPYPISSSKKVKSVKVELESVGHKKLEYSVDGIIYENYTGPITITENTKIYAIATNDIGSTYETLNITNIDGNPSANKPEEKETIIIKATPEKGSESVPVRNVEISIDYNSASNEKYYKVGNAGSWQKYTGQFVIEKNTTIYAYQKTNGIVSSANKLIDYLETGIADPIITIEPGSSTITSVVTVTIQFDTNATTKRYSINEGPPQTYTGPFEVSENGLVTATSNDLAGNTASSNYLITNVYKIPDKIATSEMYFWIKLRYPSTTSQDAKEYKWQKHDWKKYPEHGILLIKPMYKDQVINEDGKIFLLDDKGEPFEFKGDWYLLDIAESEISSNLFSRWINEQVLNPIITPSTVDWAPSVDIAITYSGNLMNREYKLIYEDGTTTDWLEYNGIITIDKNNTTIYARSQNTSKVYSKVVSYTIEKIDSSNAGIQYVSIKNLKMNEITVLFDGLLTDGKIIKYNYSIDGINWIESNTNTYTFDQLEPNKEYVIQVKVTDEFGKNYGIYSRSIKTLIISSPTFTITPKPGIWSSSKDITINYVEGSFDKEYSIDNGITWLKYTGPFKVTKPVELIARITDGKNTSYSAMMKITTIDSTPAIIEKVEVIEKSSKLEIKVTAHDKESTVVKYHYSLDGITYDSTILPEYTFTGLYHNKNYKVYVKVENLTGELSEAFIVNQKTANMVPPMFTTDPKPEEWGYTKNVTIQFPYIDEDCVKQYSLNNGTTWVEYSNPVEIDYENATIIARIISGPNIITSSSLTIGKIDRSEPTIWIEGIPKIITMGDAYSLPTGFTVNNNKSGGSTSCRVGNQEIKNTNELRAGKHNIECTVTTGAGHSVTINHYLPVLVSTTLEVDSIVGALEQYPDLDEGDYNFLVKEGTNEVVYPVELWNYDTTTYNTTPQLCDNVADEKMCIIKYNGDLVVEKGITLTPQVRKKGFLVYVTGKLTNNGTISMSARGAKAEGENVYLWQNTDGSYEYIPALGGTGGLSNLYSLTKNRNGFNGLLGIRRSTGGGGSGASNNGTSGAGSDGTSYSGGTGGGGAYNGVALSGEKNGGSGGNSLINYSGSGAGNPAGSYASSGSKGENGTGGLLIIYASTIENNASIQSDGSAGGKATNTNGSGGGASGGGTVNIFYRDKAKITGTITANGGLGGSGTGGNGGNGSIYLNQITKNQVQGTKTNPFEIHNKEQLLNLANIIPYYPNAYVVLMNDIDLNGETIGILSYKNNPFTGSFDGNNHTISNMVITNSEGSTGLFGSVTKATIKNLKLNNISIQGTEIATGSLIGEELGNSIIENIEVKGTVVGSNNTGGIIGLATNTNTINNVSFSGSVSGKSNVGGAFGMIQDVKNIDYINTSGTITATDQSSGGIIGYQEVTTTEKINIQNMSSSMTVNGTTKVGGLIGSHVSKSIGEFILSNSFATGSIKGTSTRVGGLIGSMESVLNSTSEISKTYATGNVTGTNEIGGLVGYITYTTLSDSYSTSVVKGSTSIGSVIGSATYTNVARCYGIGSVQGTATNVGGMVGIATNSTSTNAYFSSETTGRFTTSLGINNRIERMLYQNRTYSTWDFNTVWDIEEGESLAFLRDMPKPDSINKENILYYSYEGNGSETNPYLIYTISDLEQIIHELDSYYKLMNDIDLPSGYIHKSIGSYDMPFTGGFDGNNFKITGLKMSSSSTSYTGLFGALNNAIVQNLTIENANIVGRDYIGVLTGSANGNTIINNCNVSGTIQGSSYVGGLAGEYNHNIAKDASITNNVSTVTVTSASGGYAASLIGSVNSNTLTELLIENNTVSGPVTSSSSNVGGMFGYVISRENGTIIMKNNNYSGSVKAGNNSAGVIGNIINSKNGSIIIDGFTGTQVMTGWSTSASYTGGFAGYIQNNGTGTIELKNLTIDTTMSTARNYTGGVIGWIENKNTGTVKVTNSNIDTKISNISTGSVGGIVGYQNNTGNGNIIYEEIDLNGNINTNLNQVGGLIGYHNAVGGELTIKKVKVNAEIKATSSAGGLIGLATFGNASSLMIEDSMTKGLITGSSSVGGLLGNTSYAQGIYTIKNSYSEANVNGSSEIGGLIGYNSINNKATMSLIDSYSTGDINASSSQVGGLIGLFTATSNYAGSITFQNIYSTGKVKSIGGTHIGGLIGNFTKHFQYELIFDNAYTTGEINGAQRVGGLIGTISAGNNNDNNKLTRLMTSGNVTATGNYVGGLIGYAEYVTIENAYTTGKITSPSTYVGGIAGNFNYSSLKNTYTLSNLIVATRDYTGALVGGRTSSTATNSYYASEANGIIRSDLGIDLKLSELVVQETYKDWNFEKIWDIELGKRTAFLRGMTPPDATLIENHPHHKLTGAGTQENPYLIYTSTDLAYIKHDLSASYRLMNDITFNIGETFEPIGEIKAPFKGTVDGNNFKIKGLIINQTFTDTGLFSAVDGASIKNLIIEDASITGTEKIGILIGTVSGSVTITNVSVHGNINSPNASTVGGLIGYLNNTSDTESVIKDCNTNVTISANTEVGGLIGDHFATKGKLTITDTDVTAIFSKGSKVGGLIGREILTNDSSIVIERINIDASIKSSTYSGGLIGTQTLESTTKSFINDIDIKGSINSTGDYTGGLLGETKIGTSSTYDISNVKTNVEITGTRGYVGGLIGYTYASSTGIVNINNVVTNGNITTTGSQVGGLIGNIYILSTGKATIENSYTTGNITGGSYTGGLYGDAKAVATSILETHKVYATGAITGGSYVGGLAGGYDRAIIDIAMASNTVTGTNYVGGLFGRSNYSNIANVYATATIKSSSTHTGGLIGYLTYSTLTNSYATGIVDVQTRTNTGGLIGYSLNSTIENSYFSSETSGLIRTAGGINLRVPKLLKQSSYNNWNFTTIWDMTEDSTSAYLRDLPKTTATNVENLSHHIIPGNGQELPYSIYTLEDLNGVRDELDANYKLMNDIVLPDGYLFDPIGETNFPFTGTFDGNNYKISNLNINQKFDDTGLFAITKDATIKDLTVEAVTITGENNTAILIGQSVGYLKINNIKVTGTVNGKNSIGGVVGLLNNTTTESTEMTNVVVDIITNKTNSNKVGGLIGSATNALTSQLIIDKVAVNATMKSLDKAGGLIGEHNDQSTVNSSIKNIVVTGLLEGSTNTGGLIGELNTSGKDSNLIIQDIKIESKIVAKSNYTAGLVGSINSSANSSMIIQNVELTKEITGSAYTAGLVGGFFNTSTGTTKITNIKIPVTITSSSVYAGGLIAYLEYRAGGTVKIDDIAITGDVVGNNNYVGGFIGRVYNSSFSGTFSAERIYTTGDIKGLTYVGGLIGSYRNDNKNAVYSISKSYSSGSVTGTGTIIGGAFGEIYNATATNIFTVSSVTGNDQVGGFVGTINGATIENSYSLGEITYKAIKTGGFVGSSTSSTVTNSYYVGEVTKVSRSAGGLNKRLYQMLTEEQSYNNWDFNNIWDISTDENNQSTAYLKGLPKPVMVDRNQYTITDLQGTGTQEDPYLIYTVEEFDKIRYGLNEHYKLMNDLDFTSVTKFNPIGELASAFTGELNGNNKKLSNIKIDATTDLITTEIGLFGVIYDANIYDLTVDNIAVIGGTNTATFIGAINSSANINNITVTGTSKLFQGSRLSGFIGSINTDESKDTSITNINLNVEVLSQSSSIGAFAGEIRNSLGKILIDNISMSGTISGVSNVGGLVGYFTTTNAGTTTISNVESNLIITGQNSYIGGLIGNNQQAGNEPVTLKNIVINGSITTNNAVGVGGFIGLNRLSGNAVGNINNIQVNPSVNGNQYVGGLIGDNTFTSNKTLLIEDVIVTGNVTATAGQSGGFIGKNNNGATGKITINRTAATGNVSGTTEIGGYIGIEQQVRNSTNEILNTYTTGNVEATANYVGGLVGRYVSVVGAISSIDKVYTTGNVTGTNSVGGLIGESTYAFVKNTFTLGNVKATDVIGAFIGNATSTTIESSYAMGIVDTSGINSGGFVGKATNSNATSSYFSSDSTKLAKTALGINIKIVDMLQPDPCYAIWDFENTWTIENGRTLAYLKNMPKPSSVNSDQLRHPNLEGEGTKEKPYEITNYEQLMAINTDLSANYQLLNDIEIPNNRLMYTIGYNNAPFKGVLDGNNFKIKNYNLVSIDENLGIFGVTENATIKNLVIENIRITANSTKTNFGTLIGYAQGITTIENVKVTGSVTSNGNNVGGLIGRKKDQATITNTDINVTLNAKIYVGGLIGYSEGANQIERVKVESNEIKGTEYLGGLIGYASGANTVSDTYTEVEIEGNKYVGGLYAYLHSTAVDYSSISKSSSKSSLSANNSYLGGLIADAEYVFIDNSYTEGYGKAGDYAGALIGKSSNCDIEKSYTIMRLLFSTTISTNFGVVGQLNNTTATEVFYPSIYPEYKTNIGIKKTFAELSDIGTYNGWDFNNTWVIKDTYLTPSIIGGNDPILKSETNTDGVYSSTNAEQIYVVPKTGRYKLEVWGAQGGYRTNVNAGGKGGYSSGTIELEAGTTLYVYVGSSGQNGGYNGGGARSGSYKGGGGATDIRVEGTTLNHRLIVAGGGGSDGGANCFGGAGGGLNGIAAVGCVGSGGGAGTQLVAGTYGSFGTGGFGYMYRQYSYQAYGYGGAGGGGWYGGGGIHPDAYGDDDRGGSGGSGYVLTNTSDKPTTYALGEKYYMTSPSLITGNELMPSYYMLNNRQMTGNLGNGFATITLLEKITTTP